MTPGVFGLVVLAGAVGAGLRYLVDDALTRRTSDAFSWGLFVINVTGSAAIGVLTGAGSALGATWVSVLGVGLLGGYTTFSAVSVDAAQRARADRRRAAWLTLLVMCVVAVAAVGLGWVVGSALATAAPTR